MVSYDDHPRKCVWNNKLKQWSTAAGKYQILERYFDYYRNALKLYDFSPEAQDAIAMRLIAECHAIEAIDEGRFDDAVHLCRSRWASFPDAGHGQRENKIDALRKAYSELGGTLKGIP